MNMELNKIGFNILPTIYIFQIDILCQTLSIVVHHKQLLRDYCLLNGQRDHVNCHYVHVPFNLQSPSVVC